MKTAKELKLTKTQHKNLAKLTVFVRDKVAPPKFDINRFFISKNGEGHCFDDAVPSCEDYQCGTSACFLGYAVLADIKPQKNEIWEDYGKRCFGVGTDYSWTKAESFAKRIFRILFDDQHKNSKSAAVKRGAYFLMNGLPENVDLETWEAPRSFKPDWEAIEAIANS